VEGVILHSLTDAVCGRESGVSGAADSVSDVEWRLLDVTKRWKRRRLGSMVVMERWLGNTLCEQLDLDGKGKRHEKEEEERGSHDKETGMDSALIAVLVQTRNT